jgi:hypothetical protein
MPIGIKQTSIAIIFIAIYAINTRAKRQKDTKSHRDKDSGELHAEPTKPYRHGQYHLGV